MRELPLIDAHFHLGRPEYYSADDFIADVSSGHNVQSSVYVECGLSYDETASPPLRVIGETRYIVDRAEQMAQAGHSHAMAAGILGAAELLMGERVMPIIEAHEHAAKGRFRGIRYRSAWSSDPVAGYNEPGYVQSEVAGNAEFIAGARCLMRKGLVLDLWVFHPQLPAIATLARLLPDLTIVVDHIGGPLGVGAFASQRDKVMCDWRAGLQQLARLPNVYVKLSGLGIGRIGFGYQQKGQVASSDELAKAWQPLIRQAVEIIGPERSVFASNYPVDRAAAPYGVLLNAYKKILGDFTPVELAAIFGENAQRVYHLPDLTK